MKKWVSLARVEPPNDETLMMRHGGSISDGYYSSTLNQWFTLLPGDGTEKVGEPDMLWLGEEYAREHPRSTPAARARQRKWPVQLSLDFHSHPNILNP